MYMLKNIMYYSLHLAIRSYTYIDSGTISTKLTLQYNDSTASKSSNKNKSIYILQKYCISNRKTCAMATF